MTDIKFLGRTALEAFFQNMTVWLEDHSLWVGWLAIVSLMMFLGTLIGLPFLVVKIPEDYFAKEHRNRETWKQYPAILRWLLLIGKNLLGAILVFAGILMLVLPGQGILTIFIGLLLVNFPGKYRLEKWLVTKTPVLKAANWLRKKANHPPIQSSDHTASPTEGPKTDP